MQSRYSQQLDMTTQSGWNVTRATVTSCRRSFNSFFSAGVISDTGGPPTPTTYVAIFEYQVSGTKYSGKMRRSTPIEPGHHFEISYDPKHPSRNTGSDFQGPWWFRIMVWTLGAALGAALIYLDRLFKS
ncbi:DUF3592 domain-containing protein [Edaphobacter bradus]|uniref:DUF3592 domain-containing protein n=1 Tax=Edaphobacter bradus TaxID=2259016 RepID=UPI0037C19212